MFRTKQTNIQINKQTNVQTDKQFIFIQNSSNSATICATIPEYAIKNIQRINQHSIGHPDFTGISETKIKNYYKSPFRQKAVSQIGLFKMQVSF